MHKLTPHPPSAQKDRAVDGARIFETYYTLGANFLSNLLFIIMPLEFHRMTE